MQPLLRLLNRDRKTMPKTTAPLTCEQLYVALEAALQAAEDAGFERDGPVTRALNALADVLTSHAKLESEPALVPEGDLPVTAGQVDEALLELSACVAGKPLRVLRQARDLLARAEEERAAAPPQYVTREELDARDRAIAVLLHEQTCALQLPPGSKGSDFRYRLLRVIQSAGDYKLPRNVVAELKRFDKLLDAAADRAGRVERKRAYDSREPSARGSYF